MSSADQYRGPAQTGGVRMFAQLRDALARVVEGLHDDDVRAALAAVQWASGAAAADLYVIDSPSGDLVHVAATVTGPGRTPPVGLVEDAVRSAAPIWLRTRDELVERFPEAGPGTDALLAFPLQIEGRPVGAIALHYAPIAADGDAAEHEVAALAGVEAAAALETLQLRQFDARSAAQSPVSLQLVAEQHQNLAFERRLQDVLGALSGATTAEAVTRIAVARSLRAFGASAAVVALADSDTGALHVRDVEARSPMGWRASSAPRSTHRIRWWLAFRADEPVLVSSPEALVERYPALAAGDRGEIGTLAAVPLHSTGRLFGAILLAFPRRHMFSAYEPPRASAGRADGGCRGARAAPSGGADGPPTERPAPRRRLGAEREGRCARCRAQPARADRARRRRQLRDRRPGRGRPVPTPGHGRRRRGTRRRWSAAEAVARAARGRRPPWPRDGGGADTRRSRSSR